MLAILLSLLFIMIRGGSAYAQLPPRNIQQDSVYTQQPPQNIQQDTVTEEAAPQPEVPKQTVNIALKNDRLSVDLINANLGEIIQSIAKQAAFSIEGYSSVFSKTITTKFNDLEIDRGIIRLFSLVKEKNYLINYDTKGAILKLEIYGGEAAGSIPKTPARPQVSPARQQVSPPVETPSQRPAISRPALPAARRISPVRPNRQAPQTQQTPQVPQTPQAPEPADPISIQEDQNIDENLPAEDVKEIPYIPPQRKPVFIPPIKR